MSSKYEPEFKHKIVKLHAYRMRIGAGAELIFRVALKN